MLGHEAVLVALLLQFLQLLQLQLQFQLLLGLLLLLLVMLATTRLRATVLIMLMLQQCHFGCIPAPHTRRTFGAFAPLLRHFDAQASALVHVRRETVTMTHTIGTLAHVHLARVEIVIGI